MTNTLNASVSHVIAWRLEDWREGKTSKVTIPKHKIILRVFTAIRSPLYSSTISFTFTRETSIPARKIAERRDVLRLTLRVWMNQWRRFAMAVFRCEDFIIGCECSKWNRLKATASGINCTITGSKSQNLMTYLTVIWCDPIDNDASEVGFRHKLNQLSKHKWWVPFACKNHSTVRRQTAQTMIRPTNWS